MDSGMTGLQMNELATEIADALEESAPLLRVRAQTLPSGARVIDAELSVGGAQGAFLPSGELRDPGLVTALRGVVAALVGQPELHR